MRRGRKCRSGGPAAPPGSGVPLPSRWCPASPSDLRAGGFCSPRWQDGCSQKTWLFVPLPEGQLRGKKREEKEDHCCQQAGFLVLAGRTWWEPSESPGADGGPRRGADPGTERTGRGAGKRHGPAGEERAGSGCTGPWLGRGIPDLGVGGHL